MKNALHQTEFNDGPLTTRDELRVEEVKDDKEVMEEWILSGGIKLSLPGNSVRELLNTYLPREEYVQ